MEFYVFINDSQQGPFTLDQLASLDITPETEVWTEGMDDWKQAGDVPALTSLLQQQEYRRARAAQASQVAPPPTRLSQPQTPEPTFERAYAEPATPAKKDKRGGGCLLWTLIVTFVMLVVLVVTVPSREDHLNTIKDVTREWLSNTVNETGMGGSILGEVATWVGGTGADLVIDQMFSYDNYFICSMGTFNYGTRSKHVSFGILGHVFTFGTVDINDAIKQAIHGNDEPVVEVAPEVEEQPQESYDEPQAPIQDDEEVAPADGTPNAAQELLDSIAARAKREAVKAAKEWAKKKIDEM